MLVGLRKNGYVIVASIETGRRNVTLQNLAKIASGFGITLSELFEDV